MRRFGLLLAALFLIRISPASAGFIGVNYGTDGDNLPTPQQVVEFLQKQGVTQVRIFNYDAGLLQAFSGSNIRIMVGIPNEEIKTVGTSNATAAEWVRRNIAAYLPGTNITGIAVGSQVLTHYPQAAAALVPAMRYIHAALVAANLDTVVQISTPHSTSLIQNAFPPSQAAFNSTFANSIFLPLLNFLTQSQSYFMLNIYPQVLYAQNRQTMSLDYALSRPNTGQLDTVTNLLYTSAFEAMIDAAYTAMAALNFTSLPIVVSESGWPAKGDPAEIGVSHDNAATYVNNLVKRIVNNTGTPRRPGLSIDTYIYELFNEDMRTGASSEKNYGVFYPDQTPVYGLDLTGRGGSSGTSNGSSTASWCVAKQGVSDASLQAGLDYACGPGRADCSEIQPGQPCYLPDTIYDHASYAFNAYYQKSMMIPGSCDFSGDAAVTLTDPSHGQCLFPTIIPQNSSSNGTFTNGTISSAGLRALRPDKLHPLPLALLAAMLLRL